MKSLRNIIERINFENVENALRKRVFNLETSMLIVVVAVGVYTLFFSYFTIMKNHEFRTYAWDLGIFNQALWTTVRDGKFFYYTPELLINPSGSFFGIHVSPILLLILPFYAAAPSPQTLLVIQSFVLALGSVPLYKLAKDVLGYRVAGLAFALVYLLYPPMQGINWFDFHVQSFLPLFFFSTMYFFERQNWKAYFPFVLLSLMVEEHASIVVVFIGFFGLLQRRKQLASIIKTRNLKDSVFRISVITIILAVLWYIMILWIQSFLFPINPNFTYEFKAAANWSILGVQDPIMVPFYVFLYPVRAVTALGYDFLAKLAYILILVGPLALRPLYRPRYILPAVPWLFFALFSNYQPYYGIFNQYPAYVISFIFVAAVFSTDKPREDLKVLRKSLATISVCSLMALIIVSPLSPVVSIVYPEYGTNPVTQHEELIRAVLNHIPQNAAIMTQNNIFPHVSSRINAYAIPVIHQIWTKKSEAFTDFTNETLEKVEYVLIDFKSDTSSSRLIFSLMRQNHRFKVFVAADSIILFKKDYAGEIKLLTPYRATFTYNNLTLYSGEIVDDINSTSGSVLFFVGSSGPSPMFWYGPRTLLPPGEYNITIRLKVNVTNTMENELLTTQICMDNGQKTLITRTFFASEFVEKATWTNQTFYINLDEPLIDFEVRAVNVSNQANIHLDYIEVKQIR